MVFDERCGWGMQVELEVFRKSEALEREQAARVCYTLLPSEPCLYLGLGLGLGLGYPQSHACTWSQHSLD